MNENRSQLQCNLDGAKGRVPVQGPKTSMSENQRSQSFVFHGQLSLFLKKEQR